MIISVICPNLSTVNIIYTFVIYGNDISYMYTKKCLTNSLTQTKISD